MGHDLRICSVRICGRERHMQAVMRSPMLHRRPQVNIAITTSRVFGCNVDLTGTDKLGDP